MSSPWLVTMCSDGAIRITRPDGVVRQHANATYAAESLAMAMMRIEAGSTAAKSIMDGLASIETEGANAAARDKLQRAMSDLMTLIQDLS